MGTKRAGERRLVAFRLPVKDLVLLDALAAELTSRVGDILAYNRTDTLCLAIRLLAEQELGRGGHGGKPRGAICERCGQSQGG
jgi:hypothetical protein